jgi:hypothetical protein
MLTRSRATSSSFTPSKKACGFCPFGADGAGNFVYTITDNRITRLAINIGLTDSGRTEVTGGLSKETPVVTTFSAAPPPGTAVRKNS